MSLIKYGYKIFGEKMKIALSLVITLTLTATLVIASPFGSNTKLTKDEQQIISNPDQAEREKLENEKLEAAIHKESGNIIQNQKAIVSSNETVVIGAEGVPEWGPKSDKK